MSFTFHAGASDALKSEAVSELGVEQQQAPAPFPFLLPANPTSIPLASAAIQGPSPRSYHRRAYSDTWAFLGQPSGNSRNVPEQLCNQGNIPIPELIPELQGMEIDPVGQHQPQQRQPQQANLGSSNVPSMGLQHTLLQLQAPAPATFSSRGGSNRPPNMNNQASLPLPTTLRGFGEVKQELEPAPGMDRMPSLPVPEDMGLGENGRLLDGLDLPAPPPPPSSFGVLFNAPSQGSLISKAGGPAAKLRVQKNTSMKRASTTMHGRSDQELMMLDPKNVKRILANRQSAAKSKERRLQHAIELEHKLAAAQEEFDQVNMQLQDLQMDNATLTQYNEELLAQIPQLQAQVQQLTSTSKLLVEEVLQAQRMLGLPLNVPDAAPAAEGDVLPLPLLRHQLNPF